MEGIIHNPSDSFEENIVKECLTAHRFITNRFPSIKTTKEELRIEIINANSIEYNQGFFVKDNLLNSKYDELKYSDYEYFKSILKEGYIQNGGGSFEDYRRLLIRKVLHGKVKAPLVLKGTNEIFWLLSGEPKMLVYKLMGICPIVREICINTELK